MEVCCLKMASRCRPTIRVTKDITQLSNAGSSHDCGSLSRVVMVRKTDQTVVNHVGQKNPQHPQCEVTIVDTIQTYKGHKPEQTVVYKKKRDFCNEKLLMNSSINSTLDSLTLSLDDSNLIITNLNHSSNNNNNNNNIDSTNFNKIESDNNNNTNNTDNLNNPNNQSNKKTHSNSNSNLNSIGSVTDVTDSGINSISNNIKLRVQSSTNMRQKSLSPLPLSGRSIFNNFELECLKVHNELRAKHMVPPLKLSKRICRYAEEWAKVIASRGVLVHRSNSQYGENIFCSWSSTSTVVVNGREPVEAWYSELVHHPFGKEPTTLKTGHFTQVVWKDSALLGVGMAKNRSGQVFVVANYDPPGNYIGSFAKNVPPLGGFDLPKIVITKPNESPRMRPVIKKVMFETDADAEFDDFTKLMLKHHNEYRRKHGSPDLVLTGEMVHDAKHWAETLARDDRFTYRQNSKYGENLYCLWSSDRNAKASPKDICRSWYDESKQFTFNVEPRGGLLKAGQFSQMVWKSTKEIGVGMAKTRNGKVIVVATYYPRGNIIGQYLANVSKGR